MAHRMQHVSGVALRADRALVLTAVLQDPRALLLADNSMLASRDIVLAAVSRDWRALRLAALELRNDRGVVLAALLSGPSGAD